MNNETITTQSTLRVEGVTKRFGAGATEVVAVRNVSLAVAPGEIVRFLVNSRAHEAQAQRVLRRAGVDLGEPEKLLNDSLTRLRQLKQVYFPGR